MAASSRRVLREKGVRWLVRVESVSNVGTIQATTRLTGSMIEVSWGWVDRGV